MTPASSSASPGDATTHVRRLTGLTEALIGRLENETRAFAERRPQDIAAGLAQTQDMANLYRRETAQLKATPGLATAAPLPERQALFQATQRFEAVLARHASAVEAARVISEGIVQAIAGVVASSRLSGTGYGASGQATVADGLAITLNRSA